MPPAELLDLRPPPALDGDESLFLDFDGTLVELAGAPDAIVVDDALRDLLIRLGERLDGRVAIVSGRSVEQLDAFLGDALAGVAVVGSHGAETRAAGGALVVPDRPDALAAAERALVDHFADRGGVVIERKSLGVAVHYRHQPEAEAEANDLVARYAGRAGLVAQPGKMMAELRLGGADKGSAIAALLQQPPFAAGRPVFLGDDVTDEDGFRAVAAAGGAGVLVGEARATAATHRLDGVAAVRRWLAAAA
ncbi:trehalose 6-phosphatase [Sphingomonas guangdongensis]|uniref:Trehalose 6-phosphate phosphatase n=1 Tax=Sphingomonas guangdongensis TaxID=1141890 RepID=A0A285QHF0_9SPHN|nr:trehalose-phosphatase [Sphingomonas guangdongensis]SOB80859.1 trehalose 6-phosphatase [Sphingomonas guangdongensis]